MTLLLGALLAWGAVSLLALLGGAAVCRSGHVEDVARGFDEPDGAAVIPAPRGPVVVPAPDPLPR